MTSRKYKIVKDAEAAPHLLRGGESPVFDFAFNVDDLKSNDHSGKFGKVMGGALSRNLSSQQSRTLLRNYGWAKYGAAIKTISILRTCESTSTSDSTAVSSGTAASSIDLFRSEILGVRLFTKRVEHIMIVFVVHSIFALSRESFRMRC